MYNEINLEKRRKQKLNPGFSDNITLVPVKFTTAGTSGCSWLYSPREKFLS